MVVPRLTKEAPQKFFLNVDKSAAQHSKVSLNTVSVQSE